MCCKYGWTKDYVGDALTIEQIIFFYEEAKKQELRALRLQTICVSRAVSAAVCGDKDGRFQEFLEMLSGETRDVNDALDQAKDCGLPIEDK